MSLRSEVSWTCSGRLIGNVLCSPDPSVVFILKHLKLSGCETTNESIHCAPCDATKAGGFSSDHGVLLCQDRLTNKSHMGVRRAIDWKWPTFALNLFFCPLVL